MKTEKETAVIVAIDDDFNMRTIIEKFLTEENLSVHSFASGNAAFLKMPELSPDLILLDMQLEHERGIDILKTIRATPRFNEIPIIFLSGTNNRDLLLEALESGANDFVAKPFHTRELLARIWTNIRLSRQKQKLERTLREAPVIIVNFDDQLIVRSFNRQAQDCFSFLNIGHEKSAEEIFANMNDGDKLLQALQSIRSNPMAEKKVSTAFVHPKRGERKYEFAISTGKRGQSNSPYDFILFGTDITPLASEVVNSNSEVQGFFVLISWMDNVTEEEFRKLFTSLSRFSGDIVASGDKEVIFQISTAQAETFLETIAPMTSFRSSAHEGKISFLKLNYNNNHLSMPSGEDYHLLFMLLKAARPDRIVLSEKAGTHLQGSHSLSKRIRLRSGDFIDLPAYFFQHSN